MRIHENSRRPQKIRENHEKAILEKLEEQKLFMRERLQSTLLKTKESANSEFINFKVQMEKELELNKSRLEEERRLLKEERKALVEERNRFSENLKQKQAEDLARKKREEDQKTKVEWEKLNLEKQRVAEVWKKWEKEKLNFIKDLQ